jgi:hypothetical protein
MLATAREQSRAFSFLRSLRPFSVGDLIMPVVDERLIAEARTLRAQGMTQDEIAVGAHNAPRDACRERPRPRPPQDQAVFRWSLRPRLASEPSEEAPG